MKLKPSQELKDLNERIKQDIVDLREMFYSRRILVIDNNFDKAILFKNAIKAFDHYIVVDHVNSGVEGLKTIVQNPRLYTDLVFDVNIPDIDGIQLLDILYKQNLDRIFKIWILTSAENVEAENKIEAFDKKIVQILKPVCSKLFLHNLQLFEISRR